MRIDKVNKKVYVRQSWLNDMANCPERARFGTLRPEFRTSTDATIIGTSLHAGIESVLRGESDYNGMLEVVNDEYRALAAKPHKVTNIDQDKIPDFLKSMSQSFYEGILPSVKLGGLVEHKFQAPLGVMVNDMAVWVEGTMDYVDTDGIIWDWKTASRTYNIKEKQKSSIQASVYASACVRLGLSPQFPVDFRYGVMVRNTTPKHQVVSLVRSENHERWLQQFVRGAINTAMNTGYENNWFMNDSSALCSESWCSFWTICKGAFIQDGDDKFPEQMDV